MPMVKFVNKTASIIDQSKLLSAKEVEKFKLLSDPEYAKGEFKFDNYERMREDAGEFYLSDPIIVEGVSY